jgi:hypothetical protein
MKKEILSKNLFLVGQIGSINYWATVDENLGEDVFLIQQEEARKIFGDMMIAWQDKKVI